MGLSGAGKTYFCNILKNLIPNCIHINADIIRQRYNDWDFSYEGRKRQAERMKELADNAKVETVILDFICPKKEFREIVKPDIIFFIDRIKSCKFDDTNNMFEIPAEDEAENFYRITN